MDFPAGCARGVRKKFFSPNPVELWLDAWCLPCLHDAMENSTLKLMLVYPLSFCLQNCMENIVLKLMIASPLSSFVNLHFWF